MMSAAMSSGGSAMVEARKGAIGALAQEARARSAFCQSRRMYSGWAFARLVYWEQ